MNKRDTIAQLILACYLTIECRMCGEQRHYDALDDDDFSAHLWKEGWRFQNDQVLCQHCTDNKR